MQRTLYSDQFGHLDVLLLVRAEHHKIHPFLLFSFQPSIPMIHNYTVTLMTS